MIVIIVLRLLLLRCAVSVCVPAAPSTCDLRQIFKANPLTSTSPYPELVIGAVTGQGKEMGGNICPVGSADPYYYCPEGAVVAVGSRWGGPSHGVGPLGRGVGARLVRGLTCTCLTVIALMVS